MNISRKQIVIFLGVAYPLLFVAITVMTNYGIDNKILVRNEAVISNNRRLETINNAYQRRVMQDQAASNDSVAQSNVNGIPSSILQSVSEANMKLETLKAELESLKSAVGTRAYVSELASSTIYSFSNEFNDNSTLNIVLNSNGEPTAKLETQSNGLPIPNIILVPHDDRSNVGIGVSNPSEKLDVAGTLTTDKLQTMQAETNNFVARDGVVGVLNITNEKKVGIGITGSPETDLHIGGDFSTSQSLTVSNLEVKTSARVLQSTEAKSGLICQGGVIGALTINKNGDLSPKLTINSKGMLSTSSGYLPTAPLDVGGNLKASDLKISTVINIGKLGIKNSKVTLGSPSLKSGTISDVTVEGTTNLTGDLTILPKELSRIGSLWIDPSGNVAIAKAISSPVKYSLDVSGSISTSQDLTVSVKSGSTIGSMIFTSNKRVGIGRQPLDNQLEVEGDMEVKGDLNVIVSHHTQIGPLYITIDKLGINKVPAKSLLEVNGDANFQEVVTVATTTKSNLGSIEILSNNNVGIGKTPGAGYLLEVAGDMKVTNDLFVSGTGISSIGQMFISNTGNTGIRKNGTVHKLEVAGSLGVDKDIYVTGGSTTSWIGNFYVNDLGKVGIGRNSSGNQFEVHENLKVYDNIEVLIPSGTSRITSMKVDPNNVGIRKDPTTERLAVDGNILVEKEIKFETNTANSNSKIGVVSILQTQKVGINKPTPIHELDITGEVKLSEQLLVDTKTKSNIGNIYFQLSPARVGVGSTKSSPAKELDSEGDLIVKKGDLNVNMDTLTNLGIINVIPNKVGININAPSKELHVDGDARVASTFYAGNPDYSNIGAVSFKRESPDTTYTRLGIKTTSPSERLHIVGNLHITDDFLIPVAKGSTWGSMTVTSSRNVGLGTATPTSTLHVVGGANSDDLVVDQSADIGALRVKTSGGEKLTLKSGKLGIGITSPQEALDIVGGGYFDGDISISNSAILTTSTATDDYDSFIGALSLSAHSQTGSVFTSSGALCIKCSDPTDSALKVAGDAIILDDLGSSTTTVIGGLKVNSAVTGQIFGDGRMNFGSTTSYNDVEFYVEGLLKSTNLDTPSIRFGDSTNNLLIQSGGNGQSHITVDGKLLITKSSFDDSSNFMGYAGTMRVEDGKTDISSKLIVSGTNLNKKVILGESGNLIVNDVETNLGTTKYAQINGPASFNGLEVVDSVNNDISIGALTIKSQKVGINTAAPSEMLEVTGTSTVLGDIKFEDVTAPIQYNNILFPFRLEDGNWIDNKAGKFQISASTGNVAINTFKVDDAAKVLVNGLVFARDICTKDSNSQTCLKELTEYYKTESDYTISLNNAGYFNLGFDGKLGINKNSASAHLDINGEAKGTTFIALSTSVTPYKISDCPFQGTDTDGYNEGKLKFKGTTLQVGTTDGTNFKTEDPLVSLFVNKGNDGTTDLSLIGDDVCSKDGGCLKEYELAATDFTSSSTEFNFWNGKLKITKSNIQIFLEGATEQTVNANSFLVVKTGSLIQVEEGGDICILNSNGVGDFRCLSTFANSVFSYVDATTIKLAGNNKLLYIDKYGLAYTDDYATIPAIYNTAWSRYYSINDLSISDFTLENSAGVSTLGTSGKVGYLSMIEVAAGSTRNLVFNNGVTEKTLAKSIV